MLQSIPSKLGKLSSGHRTGKSQFSFQSQRMTMPKNVQITVQLHSFHMPVRLCSKFCELGFSSMRIENFQMFKLDLEKAEELRSNCQHMLDHKKARELKKKSTSASLTTLKPLTVWITTNCGIFLMKWDYQTTSPASWETHMQDKKQQLELDMEQQTHSKLGKEYIKAVYCHSAYLTSMQSTSCEMPGWMNHKLEARLPREISTTSDMQMIQL